MCLKCRYRGSPKNFFHIFRFDIAIKFDTRAIEMTIIRFREMARLLYFFECEIILLEKLRIISGKNEFDELLNILQWIKSKIDWNM